MVTIRLTHSFVLFHSINGIFPPKDRNENTHLKAYPRMTFQLSILGGREIKYHIVEKEPFKLVGFKKRISVFLKV